MEDDANSLLNKMPGEEIVVTGMSGIFPNSNSVQEFMENLYNNVDMVSFKSKWDTHDPEVPQHVGNVSGMEKFDAQFFKVGHQNAHIQEPMSRKMLEHAYGAIFDSGNTQATLKNKVVGVFIGSSFSDFSSNVMYDLKIYSEFAISGCSKAMMANRISYWMDGTGPSFTLDYACASSTAALEKAYQSIKAGDCDAAVVGGGNLCTFPTLSLNMKRAGLLCLDGKTKCFDKNGDGYVRSDAISLIFLQKAKDAKRVYAEVCYAEGAYQLKANDQFLPIRKTEELQNFLNNVYSKIDIDPKDVEYVEANGAALAEADGNEVEAIASVFTGNNIVKLGSVKSNMGHSEFASGLCSLTKLCLAYHKGEIPANLHLQDPVQSIKDGKVQVVTENTKFDRGYTALNNLSLTGANYHVILKGHYKQKNLEIYVSKIPRIVLASGRMEPCVTKIFDALKSKQVDAEEIALLHNIFENDIVGHTGRGYTILDTINESTVAVSENVDYYPGVKPPLWFVFSGMGSQWAGMGADLMRIPTFAAAIEKCHKLLQPHGIDLVKVITDLDNKIFDNIVHAFVGIGAVQIGLTDILKELGIVPDYIMGHSLGEMACAYHDNTFTVEQMIMTTYSRGKAIQESTLIKGSMAAIGVGYKDLNKLCPPEIDIACHNSSESSTISGPADIMEKFVDELTKRGIFAKAVTSANVAYHSRYVKDAGPNLLRRLNEIIKNPKPRSDKWISTSIPREKWDDDTAKYSSAKYHVNNLLNPVLFEESIRLIPNNAVVVEIAPHGLLQAILKRSHKNCTHIPLTKKGTTDGVKFLLEAIGKLYVAGFNPKVEVLYPKVAFPVSTETPLLSHLVEWEHSEDWPVAKHMTCKKVTSTSRNYVFSLHDDEYAYLGGYYRNGVNVLPEAALLAFVWETLAMYQGIDFRKLSVVFKNIEFHSDITITAETQIRFTVMISKGSNNFEVTQEKKLVMSGKVYATKIVIFQNIIEDHDKALDEFEIFEAEKKTVCQDDIYKVLKMRGFDYRGKFQSIFSTNLDRTKAFIKWTEHWIPFLDSLIQLNIVSRDYNGISKPKFIGVLKININEHEQKQYEKVNGYNCYDAQLYKTYGITRCAGVLMKDITYTDVPLKEYTADVLESKTFFPFCPTEEVEIYTALQMSLQIISENSNFKKILLTKVVTDAIPKEFEFIDEIVDKLILVNVDVQSTKVDINDFFIDIDSHENRTNVILMENLLQNPKKINSLQNVSKDTFVLSLEDRIPKTQSSRDCFIILSCMSDGKKILILMKSQKKYSMVTKFIPIKFDDTFSWVPDIFNELTTTKRVVLISERQSNYGALGLVKKLKANEHNNVSVIMIDDFNAPKFDPDNDLYKEQLQKNMTINILKKGQWGSFYFKAAKLLQNQKSFVLRNLTPGNLENVSWVEAPTICGDKTLAQVYYAGLSIEDRYKTLDNKKEASLFGMDFSGINKNGEKVMGLVSSGSVASTIEVDPDLLWPVPDHWTLEDAATVPLAYVQAFYCLTIRGKLQKGKTVLICDGASSIGLASIALCLSYNSTVFTVVDSEDKKKMLLRLYPQLNESDIICSNNDDFYYTLMLNTMGQGCNYVINFTTGICREAAVKCAGEYGIFLDISENDMYNNKTLGMSFLNLDRSYIAVNILNIFRPEYSKYKKVFQECITQGIKSGVVKPLTRVVFSPIQVANALKVLSLNKHTGKILIRLKDPSHINNGLEAIPRISFSSQDVLILVCDESGIGLELADRLIERGARKIVVNMKTSPVSGYFRTKFLTWNKQEVSIKLSLDNLQTEKGSSTFIKNAMKFGTVKGIFIVLAVKHTDNGTKEDFINAFEKQSVVVMNLDIATRNCVNLSHFIVIFPFTQSVSDEYATSLTERVCDSRNEMGFPALVVRYDTIIEVDDTKSNMVKIKPQSISALFNAIETSLKLNYKNVLTFNIKKEEKHDNFGAETSEVENGMYTFYKYVNAEEDNVTSQTIVEIPTLLNNGVTTDWDPDDSYIILVPGFEGRPQIFESVAETLKMRAVSIQLGPELQGKCIEHIALYARQQLKKRFEANKNQERFHIMGFSFGVNIALELASLLEREGRTGVVHCIDSSPDALRAMLNTALGKVSEDQLQNHVLNHMYNLITESKGKELKADLKAFDTFDAKVQECLKRMNGVVKYSNEYKKLVLESAYNRIVMAQQYRPRFMLRSQLVLMKSSNTLMKDILGDDYDLSKYSHKPVEVYPLQAGDSVTALDDCRVPNIVNMFVDEKNLNQFKKKNLCDVYLSNVPA